MCRLGILLLRESSFRTRSLSPVACRKGSGARESGVRVESSSVLLVSQTSQTTRSAHSYRKRADYGTCATTTTLPLETTDDMQRSPASEHYPPRTFFFTFLLMISLLLSPLAPTTTPAAAPSNNTKRCAGRRSDLVVASIVQTLWWICAGTRTAAEKIPHPLRWNPMRHAHWNCSSYTAPPPPPP